jgi:hypothetical protein
MRSPAPDPGGAESALTDADRRDLHLHLVARVGGPAIRDLAGRAGFARAGPRCRRTRGALAEVDELRRDRRATVRGLSTVDSLSTNLSTNQSHLVPVVQLWSRGLTLKSLPAACAPG